MESNSINLNEVVTIHTGIRSRIGQKNIISDARQGENWKRGLISGSEVNRYCLKYGGYFINIDANLLWGGGFDTNVILKDKLLLVQTGDSLIT